jgi:hypothetical protein
MPQLTLRVPAELVDRLKAVAAARGDSVNAYAAAVLGAAVDPDLAGDETERLRERLARAGLLADTGPPRAGRRHSRREVARARKAAATRLSVSDLVREGRG